MISYAMSVRVHAAEGSLPHFSVLTSLVFSTTANSAGPTSTPAPDGSFTSPWSKRGPIARARFTSAGIRDATWRHSPREGRCTIGSQEKEHRSASPALLSYQYNPVHNTIQHILYIYISFVAAKHHKPQFFTKTPLTSQALTTLQLFCGTFTFSKRRFKKRLIFVVFIIIMIIIILLLLLFLYVRFKVDMGMFLHGGSLSVCLLLAVLQ